MTDPDLIAKKLAFIETCVQDLHRLAAIDRLRTDLRELRFVEHTLQIAIQAALDVASHVVSDQRLGEPRTNRELFTLLQRAGWLPEPLTARLEQMAGFRNVLVHGYAEVDPLILEEIMAHRLGDLTAFADEIRARLADE